MGSLEPWSPEFFFHEASNQEPFLTWTPEKDAATGLKKKIEHWIE